MSKLIKKSNLSFKFGYIVDDDGNAYGIPADVFNQLNEIEELLQKKNYLEAQPEAQKAPSLDGFVRKSSFDLPNIKSKTELLDAEIEKSLKLMDEIDVMHNTEIANRAIKERFAACVRWCCEDMILVDPNNAVRFDLYLLGDPLKIDEEKIMLAIAELADIDLEKTAEEE